MKDLLTAEHSQQMADEVSKAFSALWWVITIAWAGLIFYLSTQTFGEGFSRGLLSWGLELANLHLVPSRLDLLDTFLRKSAHLTEYAIFALLLYGPTGKKSLNRWRPRRAALCILAASAYSLTDEFHQLFVPGRHGSLFDCGIDTFGAAVAMLAPYLGRESATGNRDSECCAGVKVTSRKEA